MRLGPLPSSQPSDGPPPSAVRTIPVIVAPAPESGSLPDAARTSAVQKKTPVAADDPDSAPTVPASRQAERATPPAAIVQPAPSASISVVPAPAPASSIVVAVSRFLTSLSDALSGNTVPADAALGMMSETVRRGRFAPTALASPSAATTTTSVTTAVEAERMGLSGPGRIVSDRTASSGSALAITGTSTVSATINVPTATTGLVIRAKASTGAPNLTLAIDGVAVTTLMVPNTGWADLTFAGVVPAGSHKISVASTTATSTYTLYLDKISTMKGPIVDEFTGKSGSAPRDALWGVRSGSGFDSGIASYAANNVFLDGQSHLVIQAVRGKNGTYSSGWVWSKNDVSYGYGTITARIKMPKGQGIWPAFWLVGADSDTVGWPACGEIDVVELPSTTTTMYSTVHGPIAGTTSTQQAQIISTLPDLSTDYHNYWVRHLPDEITFGIDNQTLGTMTPASLQPGETWVYNRPTYIMLNVAVGGPWAGSPDNTTIFPAKMLVDSVRWDPPA
jgi:beta-glucanase (GH16 family)